MKLKGFTNLKMIKKRNQTTVKFKLEVIIDYECVRVKVSFFVSTPEKTTCLSVLKS